MAILDKTLEIVNKFVPDKNAQAELEKELRRLDIEDAKTLIALQYFALHFKDK